MTREGAMRWTDTREIAQMLEDTYPDADNVNLRFTDLRAWVLALPGFEGAPDGCNEKILEAIQAAWLEERA
jgi:FeS assembly protein IscX